MAVNHGTCPAAMLNYQGAKFGQNWIFPKELPDLGRPPWWPAFNCLDIQVPVAYKVLTSSSSFSGFTSPIKDTWVRTIIYIVHFFVCRPPATGPPPTGPATGPPAQPPAPPPAAGLNPSGQRQVSRHRTSIQPNHTSRATEKSLHRGAFTHRRVDI